jgi:RNA recognition motif-containing protein
MGKKVIKKEESEEESVEESVDESVEESVDGSDNESEKESSPEKKVKSDKVYEAKVSGLSYGASQEDIEEYFNSNGCQVESVKLIMAQGRSKGLAFVKVSSQSSLDKVLSLNK